MPPPHQRQPTAAAQRLTRASRGLEKRIVGELAASRSGRRFFLVAYGSDDRQPNKVPEEKIDADLLQVWRAKE